MKPKPKFSIHAEGQLAHHCLTLSLSPSNIQFLLQLSNRPAQSKRTKTVSGRASRPEPTAETSPPASSPSCLVASSPRRPVAPSPRAHCRDFTTCQLPFLPRRPEPTAETSPPVDLQQTSAVPLPATQQVSNSFAFCRTLLRTEVNSISILPMQVQNLQQQQPTLQPLSAASTSPTTGDGPQTTEAPPKQVAQAMDRLNHAGRLLADIRIGADRILEAMFIAAQPHQSIAPLNLFVKEDASMRQNLRDLRAVGRQLEETGVLNDSLRSRSNSWGLHMPLVCPDGAVVAYAWKRQLAGQAGASAVDRTRLALKAFTDQKRRFFPHLDDGLKTSEPASKKHQSSSGTLMDAKEEISHLKTLDVLMRLEKEVPNLQILTFERLDWLKRASSLSSSTNESPMEHSFHASNKVKHGAIGTVASEKVAVLELLFPSVFRSVVSLHPVGYTDPDAVAFFSPDESGSYVHSRGSSVHHVYRRITEHAATALHYFLGTQPETSLYSLLHWICSFQDLFSKACSKCGRLVMMDKQSAALLPPVHRPYRLFTVSKILSAISTTKDQSFEISRPYHIDCFSEEG